jgi:hypothetical protein
VFSEAGTGSIVEFQMRGWLLSLVAPLMLLTATVPARPQERAFSYRVVHPFYGTIGTFTESIARSGSITRFDSQLRVAVRILGIVVHREEGDHTEIFRGDRLVLLQSATMANGTRLDVRGEAKGDHFVVTTSAGVVEAPADVAPSDPWLLRSRGVGMVVSTRPDGSSTPASPVARQRRCRFKASRSRPAISWHKASGNRRSG